MLLPPILFAAFVVHNNGQVVVGDHSNHLASRPHFAQLFYLAAITAGPLAIDAGVSAIWSVPEELHALGIFTLPM